MWRSGARAPPTPLSHAAGGMGRIGLVVVARAVLVAMWDALPSGWAINPHKVRVPPDINATTTPAQCADSRTVVEADRWDEFFEFEHLYVKRGFFSWEP